MSPEHPIEPAASPRQTERPYLDSLAAAVSAALLTGLAVALVDVALALSHDDASGGTAEFLLATLALYAPLGLAGGLAAGVVGGAWRASFGDDALRRLHTRLRQDRKLDAQVSAWLIGGAVAAALFAGVAAVLALKLVGGANRASAGAWLLGGALAIAAPVIGLVAIPVQRLARRATHLVPRLGPITGSLLLILLAGVAGLAALLFVLFTRLEWRALDLGIYVLLGAWAVVWLLWLVLWRGPLAGVRRRIPARGALVLAAAVLAALLPAVVLRGTPSPRVALLIGNQSTGARVLLRVARGLTDGDGDGYSDLFGGPDCDDGDAAVNPDAREVPGNGIDDNCLGGDRAAGAGVASVPPPQQARPAGFRFDGNLLFVLVDTVRADRLGVSGYRRDGESLTPRLDAFAGESVRFDKVWTQSPNTPRALPSIFASRFPSQLQFKDPMNNFSDLDPDTLLLFEVLQRAKLATLGFASHFYFVRAPSILQGFDEFDNGGATREIGPSNHDIASPRIVPKVEERLAALGKDGKRFAMFVHLFEPHSTYMEHEQFPIKARGIAGLAEKYDYEIKFVDGFIGRILDAVDRNGLKEKTLVVVVSDHGEAFGVHRFAGQTMFFHGQTLYDELLRVPLLVRLPGVKPAVIDTPVMLVDLAPTLIDALGIDATALAPELKDAPFMGRSLLPAMLGKPLEPRPAYAELLPERSWNHSARALISADGGSKILYILDDRRYEVFDLAADPEERKNLWDREPDLAKGLQSQLVEWMDGL